MKMWVVWRVLWGWASCCSIHPSFVTLLPFSSGLPSPSNAGSAARQAPRRGSTGIHQVQSQCCVELVKMPPWGTGTCLCRWFHSLRKEKQRKMQLSLFTQVQIYPSQETLTILLEQTTFSLKVHSLIYFDFHDSLSTLGLQQTETIWITASI